MRRLFAVLVLLSGCDLYWNGDDDPCKDYGYGAGASEPAFQLRNPQTGQCEYGGGGYPCDGQCGPCALEGDIGVSAQPDWGACYSRCDGLAEGSCLAAAGCYAAYDEDTSLADAPANTTFKGCWETAPSGPISTGTCIGLDAQQCSRHDNCSAYYDAGVNALVAGNFTRCAPESTTTSCTNVDCGGGYHCEDQCKDTCTPTSGCGGPQCGPMCVPDGNVCDTANCGPGYQCVETCTAPTPTHAGQCFPSCVAITACETLTTETACAGRSDCTTVYNGDNCTCYPNQGCSCEILTYDHCESVAQPL